MAYCLKTDRRTWAFRSLAFLAATFIAVTCRTASAVATSIFTVDISPGPRVLDALDMNRDGDLSTAMFNEIKDDEACDNPHLRIRARNKPALMLTNFAAEAVDSFTLTIGEPLLPYIFGMGDVLGDNFTNFIKNTIYTDAGVSITGSSVSADSKSLTVNFDGLTTGKKAIFNIDLDTTDPNGFVYPDYRMVLFGAPLEGESPTTPATVSVDFENRPDPPAVSFAQACDLQGNLVDYSETPAYANENIRRYSTMDPIEVATLGVPEPSALVLALGAVAASAAGKRRSNAVPRDRGFNRSMGD
jgi:hypothetical protein